MVYSFQDVHENRLEGQRNGIRYFTTGGVSKWSWSRLFWLSARFGAWSATKPSNVSLIIYTDMCNLWMNEHNTRTSKWIQLIQIVSRRKIELNWFVCVNVAQALFNNSHTSPCGCVISLIEMCISRFNFPDINGLPKWILGGMQYRAYQICSSIVVVFSLPQQRLVAGTCRLKSAAEIYVMWIVEIYWWYGKYWF